MGECPLCGESTNKPSTRLIKESCGHSKCRLCLLNEESGCSVCDVNNGDIPCTIESIGNFDYRLPATTLPHYEELHSTPCKLDFNKIPDVFTDCPLVGDKIALNNSINQNSDNVTSNISGPQMVDMATETDDIVTEKDLQSQTVSQNTHSSLSQVTQIPTQPEVITNPVTRNQPPHQETPVVQNPNFIPVSNPVVTQQSDGRQFITIAFIANNSPNKSQHVVTPILNQCLPAIANISAVQRPAGNQCIPMIGNMNGNQFIIRNPNIVQNLMGNQSVPIIGNLNAMPNLTGNQPLSIVGNVNAVKNLVGNQPLTSITTVNAIQSSAKNQPLPTAVNSNVVCKVVGGKQSYQVTQAVPKIVESQPAPVQENASKTRKQVRTRGLPRIKTVKNVNIVQKPATNQSDEVDSKIERIPVMIGRGSKRQRQRKELPVYLIPRKPTEQVNSPPTKSPAHIVGCMSPEYKLEDYLLFNKQQKQTTKNSAIESESVNNTPIINKPSKSVINKTPIISRQLNSTLMDENFVKNHINELKQKDHILIDKTNDEKITKDISMETDVCKEQQDLNVIFNVREENEQTLHGKVEDEKEVETPSADTNSKEEYQNLDVLFDIIEKESKKLNGGMFDKGAKLDLDVGDGFKYQEENQKLRNNLNSEKNKNHIFNQEIKSGDRKDQHFNNDFCNESSNSQDLNEGMGLHNKNTEDPVNEICSNEGVSANSIENEAMQHTNEDEDNKQEENHILNTEMEYEQEESETLNMIKEYQNKKEEIVVCKTNDEVKYQEQVQTLDEKIVGVEKESENVNEELSLQMNENQYFNGEVASKKQDNYVENKLNDDNSQDTNKKIEYKEKIETADTEKDHSGSTWEEENHDSEIINKEDGCNDNNVNDDMDNSQDVNERIVEDEKTKIVNTKKDCENVNKELSLQSDENQCFGGEIVSKEKDSYDENIVNDDSQYTNENQMRFEDISDEESSSEVLNNEELESEISTEESNNDHNLDEEREILDKNVDNQDSESNQSMPIESHQEGNTSLSLDVNKDLPALETNKPDSKFDERRQKEQSAVMKKLRGRRPKKLSTKPGMSHENEQSIEIEKDEQILGKQEVNDSLIMDTTTNVTETKKWGGEVTENAQPIFSKPRRGRKKKSFSDYELDVRPEKIAKNHQSVVKKPRGRPKKSLSNTEQLDKFNSSQEIEQPASTELPNEENNHEERQNESFDEKFDQLESHVFDGSVQVHKSESEVLSPIFIRKSRGKRPKKSLSNLDTSRETGLEIANQRETIDHEKSKCQHNGNQEKDKIIQLDAPDKDEENVDSILNYPRKDVSEKLNSAQATIIKKPRGRPKYKNVSFNVNQPSGKLETSYDNERSSVKKARGRPKKSSSITEQPEILQKIETSIPVELSNLHEKVNNEKRINQNFREKQENGENKVMNADVLSQEENNENSGVDMDHEKIKSLHVDVDAINENKDSAVQEPHTANANKQPIVIKKSRGRPKKSLIGFEHQENQVLKINVSSQEEKNKTSNLAMDDENIDSLNADVDTNAENNDVAVQEPHTANKNEQSIVIKKRRGRPKTSLGTLEQQSKPEVSAIILQPIKKSRGRKKKSLPYFEADTSQETELWNTSEITNLCMKINNDESRRDVEEHQVHESQDETSQNLIVNMGDREKESLHSDIVLNLTLNDNSDSQENQVLNTDAFSQEERNEHSNMSLDIEKTENLQADVVSNTKAVTESRIVNESEQLIVIKEPREKSRKSPSSCKRQEKEIVNTDVFYSQEERNENSSVSIDVGKIENLQVEIVSNTEKTDPAVEEPYTANDNEQSIVIKKFRGRPRKSLNGYETQENQIVNTVFNEEERNLNSSVSMDIEKTESLDDNNTENKDSAIQDPHAVSGYEQSIVIKKSRGRPKKSLGILEQQSKPEVSDVILQPIVVKKSRGRPKKSLSNMKQQSVLNTSQETEAINDKESKNQNEVNDGQEYEVQGQEVLSQDETSQHLSVHGENGVLHSDLVTNHSLDKNDPDDTTPNTVYEPIEKPSSETDKSLSSSEPPRKFKVSDMNEQPIVVKKSRGRPKKSVSNIERRKELDTSQKTEILNMPEISNLRNTVNDEESKDQRKINDEVQDNREVSSQLEVTDENVQPIVAKKSRGRPRKPWSTLERNIFRENKQSIVSDCSGDDNDAKGQIRCLNGAVYREEILDTEIDSRVEQNENLQNVNNESSTLETEELNSIEDKLDTTCQSEQTAVVKKARARSKKELPDSKQQNPIKKLQKQEEIAVIKKSRGRPKKSSYEQQNKSEHQIALKLPSVCVYKKEERQNLGENVTNEESQIFDSGVNGQEENSSSQDKCEYQKSDNQELEIEFTLNEDLNDKTEVVSALSKEGDESQVEQQQCDNVSNDEEKNYTLQMEPDQEKQGNSQNLKSQDDENKENKKESSEEDDAVAENVTSTMQEQDLKKSNKVDGKVTKSNTTGRKYKKFDKINTQLIVENSKRKRKPKVLLYENEDLDISPVKKKRKLSSKNESKVVDKKSLEEPQVVSLIHAKERSLYDEQIEKSAKIMVKCVLKENDKTATDHPKKFSRNVSLPNADEETEKSESNVVSAASSQKDEDTKNAKRNRRPKILLYENEDLAIRRKSIKKKVELLLPMSEGSIDSRNIEKDERFEDSNESESPLTAKNSERVRKPKNLLYENESLRVATAKEKELKSDVKKEDLKLMKRFEIKLEPIIVLDKNIEMSFIKKCDPDDDSLHLTHVYRETSSSSKVGKNQRGGSNTKSSSKKVLSLKHEPAESVQEKKQPVDYSHIIVPGEPLTSHKCLGYQKTCKSYLFKRFHSQSGKNVFKCDFCPKKFYKNSQLTYHVRIHKGQKPFACDLCDKKFVQKHKLNRHLLIHNYTMDLECNECGKKFSSKENLKSHLLSHVQSSFVFRCNQCPKSFPLDSTRKRHELSHSSVALFKCLHCSKSFKTKYEVDKHVKIHQNVRPFVCHDCNKTFLTKAEVKRHTIIHSGNKNYTCSYCKQCFGRIDNYSRHMLHHHPVVKAFEYVDANALETDEAVSEKQQEKKTVKPKKISRTNSNPVPMPISFVQPLTPQSVPSPYLTSQNYELASVIRETLLNVNNEVPVMGAPVIAQASSSSLMDPIPLEQALVLNRQIEEKICTQSSFCEFPGLTRRTSLVNRPPSFARRSSSGSNSNSNDGTSFFTKNQERAEQDGDEQMKTTRKDIHVHWRRRTAETLKSKICEKK